MCPTVVPGHRVGDAWAGTVWMSTISSQLAELRGFPTMAWIPVTCSFIADEFAPVDPERIRGGRHWRCPFLLPSGRRWWGLSHSFCHL